MQHLVRRDVVQHEADSLGGVQPGWHRNQFTLRQADELRVRTVDRQRGNSLAWFDSRGAGAEPITTSESLNVTVPEAVDGVIVAVNVTGWPSTAGLASELSVVTVLSIPTPTLAVVVEGLSLTSPE